MKNFIFLASSVYVVSGNHSEKRKLEAKFFSNRPIFFWKSLGGFRQLPQTLKSVQYWLSSSRRATVLVNRGKTLHTMRMVCHPVNCILIVWAFATRKRFHTPVALRVQSTSILNKNYWHFWKRECLNPAPSACIRTNETSTGHHQSVLLSLPCN